MGVYGNLLSAFPELKRRIAVWTNPDRSDLRYIVGIFLPTSGDMLKRWQYSKGQGLGRAGGSAIDFSCDDELFVSRRYIDKVNLGDYFLDPDEQAVSRITGKEQWQHSGSFTMFTTQRVTGPDLGQSVPLQVKEATFA